MDMDNPIFYEADRYYDNDERTPQQIEIDGLWQLIDSLKAENERLVAALNRIIPGCEYLIEIGVMEPDFIFADAVQQAKLALAQPRTKATRGALELRGYCNTCGKVQPVAPVYSDEGPYGTYCTICNNSIGSHGDPPF